MRLALALLAVTVVLAGCGGGVSHPITTTVATTTAPAGPALSVGAGAKTLYESGGWAVVQRGSQAVALHLVGGTWRPDRTHVVKVEILGPGRLAIRQPQVAAQISASTDLFETGLWVDGEVLNVKGGGTPRKGTIYGTTTAPLTPGRHVAVAYGRTATSATAVAWVFRVV
jgi:hypothetical protein